MEYIIVFDPDQANNCLMTNSHYFLETYSDYESAKKDAELWKRSGDCKSYAIYALCSDKRNHVI